MSDITIREATPHDLSDIWALRLETTALLRSRGIDQWQYALPDQATFMEDMRQGHLFLATRDSEILAMIAIKDTPEPTYDIVYDGTWTEDCPYLVVHRLAVRQNVLGQGIGELLMRYAEDLAIKKNISYIRIDTHRNNRFAIRLFEAIGYVRRGEIDLKPQPGDRRRVVFDKKIIRDVKS